MRRRRPGPSLAAAVVAFGVAALVVTTVLDVRERRREAEARMLDVVTALTPEAEPLFEMSSPAADAVIRQWATASVYRITLVAPDGRVHADSWTLPELLPRLENHGSRPEILTAARDGYGAAVRRSVTTDTKTLYVAHVVGLPNLPTGFLRVARELPPVLMPWPGLVIVLLLAGVVAVTASAMDRRRYREVVRHLRSWTDLPDGTELEAIAEAADRAMRVRREELQREIDALRAAFAEVSEGVLLLGAHGNVRFANDAALRLLGPGVELGRPLVEAVRAPELISAVTAVSEAGGSTHTAVLGHGAAELAVRVCAVSHPLLAVAVVLRDVRGERQLERARRALVADLAHELRTPLTVLSGVAEELEDLPGGGELAQITARQVRRLQAFAEELEELSAIESGQVTLHLEAINAATVARQVLSDLAPAAAAADVALSWHGGPAPLRTDPVRLGQVVTNLVGNGIRFNRPGGTVTVRTEAEGNGVTITVADTGIGIPEAEIPLVFQRFYRVRRDEQRTGSGLGLAIVKHLVRVLGGTVRLASREGEGTTATVWLPVSPDRAER